MIDKPMDVLRDFPVRKSKQQKTRFQEAVLAYASSLGYDARVEAGSYGVRNIILGNPETASYLVTAHYDTCAWLPVPNLITPCNFPAFLGWQLLLVVILTIPAGLIGGLLGLPLKLPEAASLIALLLLYVELGLMLFGPANRHNANDNTSGVVTVLETARQMPPELRERVCFVLFDLEEGGLLGSASYRRIHRKTTGHQTIFNLDCVGEGDEILLFPTRQLRKKPSRMERFRHLCTREGKKTVLIREKGFSFYPSDQSNFPLGFGIAAFCRSKWAGYYLSKIHTNRDTNLDENNVALLRDLLISMIREQA